MEAEGYLVRLSTELLLKIFNYVEVKDLCKLRQTCKRFDEIINTWDQTLLKDIFPLVTNQESSIFLPRCQRRLPIFEKVRISENWKSGRYSEKSLSFKSNGRRKKYIPCLHVTNKSIWLSVGRHLYCYERLDKHVDLDSPKMVLHGSSKTDIEQFKIRDNLLLSGHRDGSMWLTSLDSRKIIFDQKDCHPFGTSSVDMSRNGDTIVSGSTDFVKIWTVDFNSDSRPLRESHRKLFEDMVLRVCLSDDRLIAVGTMSDVCTTSLFICDIERISDAPQKFPHSEYSPGVIDMLWDGPHTLWSCGFDSYLRKWDVRTGTCVQCFYDPQGSRMYCLDYDYYNTVMAGTEWYGQVNLWDVRKSDCVQLYYMDSCQGSISKKNSPIYSLSFDSENLFVATDQNLNVLDFSVRGAHSMNCISPFSSPV